MGDALTIVVAIALGALLGRFLPSYASEKGKNLATKEDIGKITDEIEQVRTVYLARLQDLQHQNAMLLEELRGRHQLRVAAVEKRLEAHQQAFSLWRKLLLNVHSGDIGKTVVECQEWWNNNCLYLTADAREAFNRAYFAAQAHRGLTLLHSQAKLVEDNMEMILRAGELLVAGVELPSLGEREAKDVSEPQKP
jgi:hypothetical protein